ncbi:hypothetical protein BgiMline_016604, partial [Biomphalaria glabrata]
MEEFKTAMKHIERRIEERTTPPANLTLFTESFSCLQALKSPETRHTQLAKTMAYVERFESNYQ